MATKAERSSAHGDEASERGDGVLKIRPAVAVPAEEAWFWESRWQEGEREVDGLVAAGETTVHGSADDFVAHLTALEGDPRASEVGDPSATIERQD